MDLISYLSILRRRWLLVGSTVVLSLLVVWLTLPDETQPTARSAGYTATATLVASPTTDVPPNLATVALFSTLGEVPKRAARELGYEGEPQVLATKVSTVVSTETATLTVSSVDVDGDAAARRANVFATELINFFERVDRRTAERQLADVNKSINAYASEIQGLDQEIAANPLATALVAERAGLESHYQGLVAQAAALEDQRLAAASPLQLLQRAVPVPQSSTTFAPPSNPRDRLLVGGGLGLLLGLALALVVERLDSRLRTREQVEHAFKLPVLAEVPGRPWHHRKDLTILSAVDAGSATAEAYRSLRSAVLLLRTDSAHGTGLTSRADGDAPSVIMVTSARPGDGKTSTVANLAVVMAESGRRVLVLSLDFRNPTIHDYLDVPGGSGLSDLLSADRPRELDRVVRDTRFPGVRVATSGQETSHPGALLTGAGPLIDRARQIADIVLIDTAPLLSVSDAVDISPHVDAALVVTRANRTTAGQAISAERLLSRLGVPALGAVMIGGSEADSFEGYPSPSRSRQSAARFGIPGRGDNPPVTAPRSNPLRTRATQDSVHDD